MADEDVRYVDIQPAPDSPVKVSTGPLVPADEAHTALGKGASNADEDADEAKDEDKKDDSDSKSKSTKSSDK